MAEQDSATDLYQVVRIVSSYVRHHQIEPGQLVRLIAEVHRAAGPSRAEPVASAAAAASGADRAIGAA